ncbi:hypothetical protein V5O48_007050 [Marasmius crinis-equi]|uniref:Uncharacterized protein n=1 Tax=Marasmius crinis-equi TaxID=585013 RepID=A0ABR3FI84_9AGAR
MTINELEHVLFQALTAKNPAQRTFTDEQLFGYANSFTAMYRYKLNGRNPPPILSPGSPEPRIADVIKFVQKTVIGETKDQTADSHIQDLHTMYRELYYNTSKYPDMQGAYRSLENFRGFQNCRGYLNETTTAFLRNQHMSDRGDVLEHTRMLEALIKVIDFWDIYTDRTGHGLDHFDALRHEGSMRSKIDMLDELRDKLSLSSELDELVCLQRGELPSLSGGISVNCLLADMKP